jgi:hypothetical protein
MDAASRLLPLTAICEFFGCCRGNMMDIPANQRHVLCLFEDCGRRAHSDPGPPGDPGAQRVIQLRKQKQTIIEEFSMCFSCLSTKRRGDGAFRKSRIHKEEPRKNFAHY